MSWGHPVAFFLKSNAKNTHQSPIYHRQNGNEAEPAYNLRYLDPSLPTSKNHYGVALYDPYVSDIVYGEIAVTPDWTQPTLSADVIRANGGVVPPPEPILPTEFVIQLYNPDQQIKVKHKSKSWNKPARWEFEMPQRTFRMPSSSTLDQTQSDPAAADITPKLRFSWRKDGKLSKDLSCLLHGKSTTIPDTRTKTREPDITVALFQGLRELTLYEPNLYRVEMEDFKGLEVVLLLAAVAIRDIFFGPAKEAFHIVPGAPSPPVAGASRPATGGVSGQTITANQISSSTPSSSSTISSPKPIGSAAAHATAKQSPPRLGNPSSSGRSRIDSRAEAEERRTQELLEAEKRAAEEAQRQRQAEIDAETERLKQLYGQEEQQVRARIQSIGTADASAHPPATAPSPRPNLPARQTRPARSSHNHSSSYSYIPPQQPQRLPPSASSLSLVPNGPYMRASAGGGGLDPRAQSTINLMPPRPQPTRPQSTVGFPQFVNGVPGSNGRPQQSPQSQQPRPHLTSKKSSLFGFLRHKEEGEARPRNKLDKKRSSMF
ncbi:Uncharacterized protein PECH_008503 [Penicillium ucsense]|uniref:Uncharacterized protein n=1 Tax=Penicillium ucsense TaxID=2839758 RepID=A0A8J8W114_9EURO|nr:Uncharacterized protein PECM_006403 [Penicillium ucsense]KAF7734110.1 Uncharacterized protein PECH_008503 [Penicillium ucsense]